MKNTIVTYYPLLRGRPPVRFGSGAPRINDLPLNGRLNDRSKSEQKQSKPVTRRTTPTYFWTYWILLLCSFPSLASDLYAIAGAGTARHQLNGNGVWYQDGFDHTIKSNTSTLQAGAGIQVAEWLTIEGLYHDFGKTSISADFVLPDANYDLETNRCIGRCNPLAHGEGKGQASGISLSLLPTYGINRDWSMYARVGVLWWKRKWEQKLTCCAPGTYKEGDLYSSKLHETFATVEDVGNGEYLWRGDNEQVKPINSGRAMVWGIGVRYRFVRFEYMGTRGIVAPGSGHTNLGTLTISYQARF